MHPPFTALAKKQAKSDLIGSVQRALRILELLAFYPAGLNAKQIGLELGLNLSTCYHLLNTLEHEGYIVKDPDTSLFRSSAKVGFTALAQASPAQIVRQLAPHLQKLQELTRETAYLSIWDGREITLSHIIEAPQTIRVKALTIGDTQANHASALGKAILAYLSPAQFEQYFAGRTLPVYTANTITNLATLRVYLAQVREQGYALDCEEFMREVDCICAPIFDAHHEITASMAISLPAMRAVNNRQHLIDQVRHMAADATRTLRILGYIGPASAGEQDR
ncbi:MAG TPA: IclR family transcriptional regulator [Anaerolineae bacterium]|nr:IclR family transcriptional regulator [Anaerolineae bacterium]HMR65818.1 IclR family transcriptional regulator [Anaerolineae bacterium]